ncbi:hypothetical protein SmJEL517_g04952 [Synchytrium microbalum]|uniref:GST N-terminal domain-containing protein n=1 Tax=Synchytrium microbalum TaxID=1806994 RepID=A0A507BXB9_9FUNG|nr:uncharacterized protein SmJEL517_g04952 [Synchytrium microbalum]TPX31778.1 hypothetical protein SmJEL517_g04952 [Synchytrium microbalum]
MKLYYSPTSPFVRKVVIVAREVGLFEDLEIITVAVVPHEVNPGSSSVQGAGNPLGKVWTSLSFRFLHLPEIADITVLILSKPQIPTLILEDGTVLFDSRVIVQYLAALKPAKGIIPTDIKAQFLAKKREALADGLCEAGTLLRFEGLRPVEKQWPNWAEGQTRKITAAFDAMEAEVPDMASSLATIGEIAFVCALGVFDFRLGAAWRDTHPKLAAWYKSVETLPVVIATAPKAPTA